MVLVFLLHTLLLQTKRDKLFREQFSKTYKNVDLNIFGPSILLLVEKYYKGKKISNPHKNKIRNKCSLQGKEIILNPVKIMRQLNI